MAINAGRQPAFPTRIESGDEAAYWEGMTLRDYFAAAALPGLLTAFSLTTTEGDGPDTFDEHSDPKNIATTAYRYADAMLSARSPATGEGHSE